MDYDCDVVKTRPNSVFDWDELYAHVQATVDWSMPDFSFPESYRFLLEGSLAKAAESDCPLGVLYLRVLLFYDVFHFETPSKSAVRASADYIQMLLRSFPVYTIALSRWPIFEVFTHFSSTHPQQRLHHCDGVKGVVDWGPLRERSNSLMSQQRDPDVDPAAIDDLQRQVAGDFLAILRAQGVAQEECPFGFYFVIANQVIAAAGRESHHLPNFSYVLDKVVSTIEFPELGAGGWPIFSALVLLADLNKGRWFFGGDRKYLRGYSDWNLRRDELSPLVPSGLDFLSPAWRSYAGGLAETLAGLPGPAFAREVQLRMRLREEADGEPMRPIVRGLAEAAMSVAAAVTTTAHGRRLAYVVLLYGEKWSTILARMARRLRQLRTPYPLLVIAIGEEAASTCHALESGRVGGGDAVGQPPVPHVVCWRPETQSQVHRFTAIHAMLHLGVDILYMDMDTFLLRDPAPRVLQQAGDDGGAGTPMEALFARHGDADCVNIGVFYLRANERTAIWMSQYLAWYHDHPFEVDQRGLHVFLGIPSKHMSISWLPPHLVKIRAGILEDINEVVIGDVGWSGLLSRMLIFHWCHQRIELKERELNAAYDAGDALEGHNLPLSVALASISGAYPGTPFEKVFEFRAILEQYRKEQPPERTFCW